MTGEQLYELSSMGYRHDKFENLPQALQDFYNEQAGYRRRDIYLEQRESLYKFKPTCCCGDQECND